MFLHDTFVSPVCVLVCVSRLVSTCLCVYVPMSLCQVSAYVYDPVSVCVRACVFMYVFMYLSLFICLYVSPCFYFSVSLCICLSMCLCVCMSQYMYVCLYVFQYLCFCVFVSRVCMGLYLYISVDPFFPEDSQNPGPIHSPPIAIL